MTCRAITVYHGAINLTNKSGNLKKNHLRQRNVGYIKIKINENTVQNRVVESGGSPSAHKLHVDRLERHLIITHSGN